MAASIQPKKLAPLVNKEELDELKQTIKEGIPEWVATMRRYDDPSITDMEDVWGI